MLLQGQGSIIWHRDGSRSNHCVYNTHTILMSSRHFLNFSCSQAKLLCQFSNCQSLIRFPLSATRFTRRCLSGGEGNLSFVSKSCGVNLWDLASLLNRWRWCCYRCWMYKGDSHVDGVVGEKE